MNAKERKRLTEILSTLEGLKEEVASFASNEQEKYDNMSEGLQQSEKGQAIEQAASQLSECEGSFDDIINNLSDATGGM